MLTQMAKGSENCSEPKFSKFVTKICDKAKCCIKKLRLQDEDWSPEDERMPCQATAASAKGRHREMLSDHC